MSRFVSSLWFALTLVVAPVASAGKCGDFDGDGADDVVIGNPFAAAAGHDRAGAVQVMYGVVGFGAGTAHQELWDAASLGLAHVDTDELLGVASAIGDFDGDGFDDLAFSAPGRAVAKTRGAGVVFVLYGGANGLGNLQTWHQNVPGIRDKVDSIDKESGVSSDLFGYKLVAADFDADGRDDLAIGLRETVKGKVDAGAVAVLYGSKHGLAAARNQFWTQESRGVKDHAETDDVFSADLAAGDFDGDGFPDLAIGVAGETTKAGGLGETHQGAIQVLRGGKHGLTAKKNRIYRWTDFVSNDVRSNFGTVLAVGDFNADGKADLAIGDPTQTPSTAEGAGMVSVLYGSAGGLDPATFEQWSQDSTGLSMTASEGEAFGVALATGDFDGDGDDDLVVGSPGNTAGAPHAGAIVLLHGTPAGLTATGGKYWHQGSPGVLNDAEADDYFGYGVSSGDFDGNGLPDVIIGVPGEEVAGSLPDAGAAAIFYCSQDVGPDPDWRNNLYLQGFGGMLGTPLTGGLFSVFLP